MRKFNETSCAPGALKKVTLSGFVMALVLVGFAGIASAQGGSVIYSYERMVVGGAAENVLVPVADTSLRGDVSSELLEQAFERLRRAKRSTYGNSLAEVSGRAPNFRVEVRIAADKAQFAPIIIAEAVYTLTEFGVDKVYFPGHADGGLTRADVPFAAFSLTVPLWKVVPQTTVTTAQVRMPDGQLLPLSAVQERWRNDREALIGEVYGYLNSEEDILVRSVVRQLPELGNLRLEAVTPLLTHDAAQVRQEVLNILEGQENSEPVLVAMVAALKEESNSTLARRMADFLGKSSNKTYNVEKPFYLVHHGSKEEALEATKGLSKWTDDARVVELLSQLLRDEREGLPAAAAGALEELKSHEVRKAALADTSVAAAIRMQIATDLSASANQADVRLVGLTYLAKNQTEGHANQAILAISQLPTEDARKQVEAFLNDDSRSRRLAAVSALLRRNEVESIAALLSAAANKPEAEEMRQAAYAIMGAQPLQTIIAQTEASSAAVQQVAFQAVGERARSEGASANVMATLERGTGHRSPEIRGAAALALGDLGGERAVQLLGQMLEDRSPVVRRDVALALGNVADAHNETLLKYLDDSDAGVVSAAIDAMEKRKDRRASERIRTMVNHADARIRASALRAVTTFLDRNDENAVRQHIAMLSGAVNDNDARVQLSALEQLGRFNERMAVTNIAILVGNDNVVIRTAAVRALGETGHDSALRIVESALGDTSPEVRREAIESLTRLNASGARTMLEQRMEREQDPEVKELLRTKLQQI